MVSVAIADKSCPYDLLVHVVNKSDDECKCDFDLMLPTIAINLRGSRQSCLNCCKSISADRLEVYYKYHGFHGYDEMEG